ncbi:sulfurtransferase TusA family protein [Tropicimonas sp. IMCC6043]|uniref:sulfurtransferase TusA family protein n=1 Tax=Tropicimonas sp. IMCC6043 TaxID=2510645 RepID=UPI00101DAF7D|nr:sulfurtransferase TusA family protein [Tropicimonas sp. IMCC6043]RYH09836.1 sulfurtransferase TusA family protein [Tropicimonas sp. IMCC6043]
MTDPISLDARGLLCPLPVLKARKALAPLARGAELCVLSDDPAAVIDFPHFCSEAGHALLGQDQAGDHVAFRIRKGG